MLLRDDLVTTRVPADVWRPFEAESESKRKIKRAVLAFMLDSVSKRPVYWLKKTEVLP
jgi:hypothetical protein